MIKQLLRGLAIAFVLSSGLLMTTTPVAAADRPRFCEPLGSAISWLRGIPSSGWRNALLQRAIDIWNAHCLLPGELPSPPPSGGGGVEV